MKEDSSHLGPGEIARTERIAYLVAGFIRQTLTPDEQDELDNWVAESDHNVLLFEDLIDEKNLASMTEKISKIRTEMSLEKIKKKLLFKPVSREQWLRKLLPYAVAASIIGIILSVLFINKNYRIISNSPSVVSHDIAPGTNRATLKLANGSTIILNSVRKGELTIQANSKVIKTDSGQVSYYLSKGEGIKETYNTLTTPRGGQFQLVLSDGTHVWLNSQSSIRYPVAFAPKRRTVELIGEGYFEVAKDRDKPFDVKVGVADIQVLGTHFNINAYEDEPEVRTTLLEGSVRINTQNNTAFLKPNEQGDWNITGKIRVLKDINTEDILGWKTGMFSFHREDIHALMRQVARWYDVDIQYKGQIQNHFNATIERNVPVSKLLKLLEETGGVHFSVQDKTIIVKP